MKAWTVILILIQEHEFYHKWGPIVSVKRDESNMLDTIGFVKCDLIVQTIGDKIPVNTYFFRNLKIISFNRKVFSFQLHSLEELNEEDEVDSNLILPFGTVQHLVLDLVINVQSAVILKKRDHESYLTMLAKRLLPDMKFGEYTSLTMENTSDSEATNTYSPFFKVTFGSITVRVFLYVQILKFLSLLFSNRLIKIGLNTFKYAVDFTYGFEKTSRSNHKTWVEIKSTETGILSRFPKIEFVLSTLYLNIKFPGPIFKGGKHCVTIYGLL
jgi:hypothetical protein